MSCRLIPELHWHFSQGNRHHPVEVYFMSKDYSLHYTLEAACWLNPLSGFSYRIRIEEALWNSLACYNLLMRLWSVLAIARIQYKITGVRSVKWWGEEHADNQRIRDTSLCLWHTAQKIPQAKTFISLQSKKYLFSYFHCQEKVWWFIREGGKGGNYCLHNLKLLQNVSS